jgi:ankyrin repeat protein
VNARQGGGFTALHAAAASSDTELARLLLAAGADATARADDGLEPDLDFLR